MSNSVSTAKANSRPVPRVLLQAKKEATEQAAERGKRSKSFYEKGPWDDGHWANRK